METGHEFFALVLTTTNVMVMVASSALIEAIKKLFPKAWGADFFQRTSRLLPILLCVGAVFIPGVTEATPGEKVLLGVVLGAFSGQFYDLVAKNVLRKKQP